MIMIVCLSPIFRDTDRTTASRETGRQGIRSHRLGQLDTQDATPRARPSLPKNFSVYSHMGTWSTTVVSMQQRPSLFPDCKLLSHPLPRPTVPGFIFLVLVSQCSPRCTHIICKMEKREPYGVKFRMPVRFSVSTISLGFSIKS